MENEKYGAVITAETSPFKKAINDLVSFMKNFGKEIKEDTRFEINPDISKKELLKWQEDLNNSLNKAKTNLNAFKGTSTEKYWQEDIDRYSEGLIAVNKRLKEIDDSEKEVNEDLKEINQNASQSTLGKLFDNSIKKIKHFTYYLLGARSVFSLFMKYQGIYYQYNERMQYQSELSQNAIALSLAPAFEFLGNVVAYASIGIAKFIELLTGVNVLSKVTTKGIRDYNKSLKETQTLASGIDEVTNLNMPSGTGLASQYSALNDFQKKVAEVTKWFEDNPWIQDLANALKKVWGIIGNIIEGIGGIENALILLGGIKVMSSLGKLLGAFGVNGVGATGLLGVLAVTGLITEGLHQYSIKDVNKPFEEHLKKLQEYSKDFNENMSGTEYRDKLIKINKIVTDILTKIAQEPEEYKKSKNEINKVLKDLQKITGIDYVAKIEAQLEYDPKEHEGLFNGLKDGFKSMITGFKNVIYGDEMSQSWEYFKKKGILSFEDIGKQGINSVQSIINKVNELTNKKYTLNMKAKITAEVGKASTSAAQTLSEAITKAIRGYANGLDYVPYDNYPAVLHKGEAVVPAKYNPTIHSQGNEYTNSLLETMIIKLDDLSKRPNEFIIDGQKFANATYPLYEQERSRNNYVEGVVR